MALFDADSAETLFLLLTVNLVIYYCLLVNVPAMQFAMTNIHRPILVLCVLLEL